MPLVDDLEELSPPKPGPLCGIRKVELDVDAEGLAVLHKHLDGFASHADVSRWLRKHGYAVPAGTVSRHRRKDCGCFRTT